MNQRYIIEDYFTIEHSNIKKKKIELAQYIMYLLKEDYADTTYTSKRDIVPGKLHKIIYDPVTKQQKLVINNDYISDDESNSLKLFHSMLDRSSMYT
jgi:translation elongation factor EF-Ts